MKSFLTLMREGIKNNIIRLDYLFWFLFDFSKFRKIRKNEIKKVLVIHLGALGELLMATPVFSSLKKSDYETHVMVKKGREKVLENNPNISKIWTYNEKLIDKLKKEKYNLAVILWPGSLKIIRMCKKARIKYRIGCYKGVKEGPSFFFYKRVYPLKNKHIVQKYLDIIRLIGIDNKNPKIEFYTSHEKEQNAREKLKKLNIKNYIIIHPGFGFATKYKYPSRLWSLDRYTEVINHLTERYDVKIILTGNRNDTLFAEEIIKNVKNKEKVIITTGLLDFGELATIIKYAKLIIEPSTSVGHIAAAVQTPVISLIGKGNPHEWHPWINKKKYKVLYHKEVCTGCDLMNCRKKTIECMSAISVKEVINAAEKLLK